LYQENEIIRVRDNREAIKGRQRNHFSEFNLNNVH